MLLGVTQSIFTMFIRSALRVLVKVLSKDPLARIKMPTSIKVGALSRSEDLQYSLLKYVYAAADEFKLMLQQQQQQQRLDAIIQKMFYNG